MRICLVGLDNLPMLVPGYEQDFLGGESVQQTLLARALVRRGVDVRMIVSDCGQRDGAAWDSIRVFKAYRPDAGLPVLRFIHPRWTGLWSALARADADIYYTSCAGMQAGLLALFCKRHRRKFVFRCASDSDCDRSRLLVEFARDRWLYAYGLRHADAILVQSAEQADTLASSFGLKGRMAGMLVEPPAACAQVRDIDVLWVSNIRHVKRPDRILELARIMPTVKFHMAGGPVSGEEPLFEDIAHRAASLSNVTFHGRLPYRETNDLYTRARVLVNTSVVEGFPNSYLQSWIRGVPVITLIDPDGVIADENLGVAAKHPVEIAGAVSHLLSDQSAWLAASDRCRQFMAREYGEDKVLAAYLDTFAEILRPAYSPSSMNLRDDAHHV